MTSKVYVSIRVPADPMSAFDVFTQEIALLFTQLANGGTFEIADA